MKEYFPIDNEISEKLEEDQISYMDQYIFRFAKIQDIMGEKLFRLILESVEEYSDSLAFIDILNRMEKLGVLEDKSDWINLRKLRNEVSHEYPLADQRTFAGLNELFDSKDKLISYYHSCMSFLSSRQIL
jgi:hypothetical protein